MTIQICAIIAISKNPGIFIMWIINLVDILNLSYF
jgi:hypothetical protein